ncbi:hypothetical protein EV421DRAFT_2041074 [Armillaria borealis]|uniref:Uncharacterized protein n=1 Tax=Armillaria borealis TaxID=47425 RepID=A0AA39IZK9_9AGAR|nr:hypothetical protein EV421DRAFT_2041074 [Armillaria borealis]
MLSTAAICVADEDKKEEAGRSDIIGQASMVQSMTELEDERVDGSHLSHVPQSHLPESRNDWDSCQDADEEARGCRSAILSARCSPSQSFCPKKYTEPPCKIEDIPDTDAVVISMRSSLSNSAMAYAVVSVIVLTNNDRLTSLFKRVLQWVWLGEDSYRVLLVLICVSFPHVLPDSVRRFKDIKAKMPLRCIGEEIMESPKRLAEECKKIGINDRDFLVSDIGETKYF